MVRVKQTARRISMSRCGIPNRYPLLTIKKRRAPKRNAISKAFIREILQKVGHRGMRVSQIAVQMLQAEGEHFVEKHLQKLKVIADCGGQKTLLMRHHDALLALQKIDENCEVASDE